MVKPVFLQVAVAVCAVLMAGPSVLAQGPQKGMMGRDHMGGGKNPMMNGGPMKSPSTGPMGDITSAEVPGISTGQLPQADSEGAKLLLRYCAQCHNLPSPATHSSEEWPEVVERMDAYMKAGAGKGHREMMRIKRPTDSERLTIEAYLKTNGIKPFTGKTIPDAKSPGGKLFQRICSGCHVLPDIALHTPGEWPDVVERMRMNMKVLGKEGVSGEDRDRIVEYLKKNAK